MPFVFHFRAFLFSCLLLQSAAFAAARLDAHPYTYGHRDKIPKRPNVILIIIDTLRADYLGCYGAQQDASPDLDRLAASGVQFDRVLAQSSWTRPSIGSMLTSRYPRTLGIYNEHEDSLNDSFETLAEILRGAGYTTFGFTANPNINAIYGYDQGFDVYVDSKVFFPWMDIPEGGIQRGRSSLQPAPAIFEEAFELLRSQNEEAGPFYLQFNLMEVHEWIARRATTNMIRPEYRQCFLDNPFHQYSQLVRQVNDDIAAFVDRIKLMPGWDDTLFIFVADHGEGLGDHTALTDTRYHGLVLYESNLSVPWFMCREGWTPKCRHITQQVRLLDLMPTVLEYLGLAGPPKMAGLSLLPLINGRAKRISLPTFMIMETQFRSVNKVAVYGDSWKFIHNIAPHAGAPQEELQARGIGQENGYLTDQLAQHGDVAVKMKKFLKRWNAQHPKARPTPPRRPPTPEEIQGLEAIGYLN